MNSVETFAQLRAILQETAARGDTITYRGLAGALDLASPHVIRQVGGLLEKTMQEDAAIGHPFLAAVVVSRTDGLPRRGFFELARALGRYDGDPEGPAAERFHQAEYRAVSNVWGGS